MKCLLQDMTPENAPTMAVPGSHLGPIFSHHTDGVGEAWMWTPRRP